MGGDLKKAIELIRVSTEGQGKDDRFSIPAQRSINRRTAQTYQLEIVQTIELVDVSGAAILRTPEMQQLLRLIEKPSIHAIIVREFSRVMRPENFSDYVLFQALQDTNTVLYLPDGPLDLNSKTGKLVAGLRAIIAGNELSEIRERTWAAKEEKRRAGQSASPEICLPFGVGYSKATKQFFYKPEAEHVREIFRRLLAGETSYTELGKLIDFSPQGVATILQNPIWTGWRVYDKKRDMSSSARGVSADGRQGDRRKIKREPNEIIRVHVIKEPLVSEADFARAQVIVEAKKRRHWRHRTDTKHSFTYQGFLVCSRCGAPVYGKYASGFYYACRRRLERPSLERNGTRCASGYMRRDPLEEKLDGILSEQLTDRKVVGAILEEMEKRTDASASRGRIARLQTEVHALRQKRQRILDAFFEGVIQRSERDERLAQTELMLRQVEESIMRESPAPAVSAHDLAEVLAPLFDWPFLSRDNKRRMLAVTIPEIHVCDYTVKGILVVPSAVGPGPGSSCRGYDVSLTPAAYQIATASDRIFLPLNL